MSRRDPNRRHINIDLTPKLRRQRNINRVSVSIAVVVALILLLSPFLPDFVEGDDPELAPVLHAVENALPVEVVRIIDGDTMIVRSAQAEIRVRLFGVDTPERDEPCFDEATARLEALAGTTVQLLPDARLTDSFNRELRYVYAADGALIDEQLVAEGYGFAWTADGQFREQIMAAESAARNAGRGCLWGE